MQSKEVRKWIDTAMFEAEALDSNKGPSARVISCNPDPLGSIAFAALGYTGGFGQSLADITDEQRKYFLAQMQKTAIAAPLEFVDIHFVVSGVTRGFTHQMVRQRTAVYVQESTRFAVKDGSALPVGHPPSLDGTVSEAQWWEQETSGMISDQSRYDDEANQKYIEMYASDAQRARFKWDRMVDAIGEFYDEMVNNGWMPAEDARGILPTNLLTQINYKSNLRNFQMEGGKRLCTQAQFEWRLVFSQMLEAMREYGKTQWYQKPVPEGEIGLRTSQGQEIVVESSAWQFEEIAKLFKPICYMKGSCQFEADFDRKCSIRGRVDEFAAANVPSSEWDQEGNETFMAPGQPGSYPIKLLPIHPAEWLLDAGAAR